MRKISFAPLSFIQHYLKRTTYIFLSLFHFQLIYWIYFHLRVLYSPLKKVSCVQWLLCDVCRSDLFQGLSTGLNSLSDQLHWVLSFCFFVFFVAVCPSRLCNTISNNPRLNNTSAVSEWSVNTKDLNTAFTAQGNRL